MEAGLGEHCDEFGRVPNPSAFGVDLVEGAGLLVGQEGGVVMKERLSKKGVELWINGGPKECFHITEKFK